MGKISDLLKKTAEDLGRKNESFALKLPFVKQKIEDILALFTLYHDTIEKLENEIESIKSKSEKIEKRVRNLEKKLEGKQDVEPA